MEMREMDIVFLIVALFLPRITLLTAYMSGAMPLNLVPFWGEVILAPLLPRFLTILYIYENLGVGVWFWIHIVAWVVASGVNFRGEKESKRP